MSGELNEKPLFKPPAKSCDSHFHVFGPAERYPYGPELRYKPPLAPLDEYLTVARHLGIERMVFVQPSAYGRDNTCMLDAMQELGDENCRGIVDIDDDVSDAEMDRLDTIGVRGVRINTSPVKQPEAGYAAKLVQRIERMDARCAELGWHLDFLAPGWLTEELMPTFRKLKVNFSIAHMGLFYAAGGVAQPGFQELSNLLKYGNGQAWVKFTGAYRMATWPDYEDATPMAHALVAAAPDRLLWGSDYPHLSFADRVSSVSLFNLLATWAPDEAVRNAILVDNPRRLFGF
jgi:2-pyrone-4,6-dicarboxylate lactonase